MRNYLHIIDFFQKDGLIWLRIDSWALICISIPCAATYSTNWATGRPWATRITASVTTAVGVGIWVAVRVVVDVDVCIWVLVCIGIRILVGAGVAAAAHDGANPRAEGREQEACAADKGRGFGQDDKVDEKGDGGELHLKVELMIWWHAPLSFIHRCQQG